MAIKSHKIALDATDEQCTWFSQQCGYARFAFNYVLSDYNDEPRHWKELNSRFNKAKRDFEKKLKREQRKLSKKESLSNNWYKQKRKVQRIHYKMACIRNDARHKATTEIVNMASVIGIETLKITNMLKNKNLAKALSDSALGGFLAMLKSKADILGIPIKEAPQFYASSKTCSNCGHKKEKLLLSERQYNCNACGISIDRDQNAAINLKHLAVGLAER